MPPINQGTLGGYHILEYPLANEEPSKPINTRLLRKHIAQYINALNSNPDQRQNDVKERADRSAYYQSWTVDRLKKISEEEFGEYVSKLRPC